MKTFWVQIYSYSLEFWFDVFINFDVNNFVSSFYTFPLNWPHIDLYRSLKMGCTMIFISARKKCSVHLSLSRKLYAGIWTYTLTHCRLQPIPLNYCTLSVWCVCQKLCLESISTQIFCKYHDPQEESIVFLYYIIR